MSHIFDALQRSELERSGIDLSALSEATEMLQRAERGAASKWESTVFTDLHDAPQNLDLDKCFALLGGPATGATSVVSATAKLSQTEDYLDPLSQFQSLQVSFDLQSRLVSLTESESPAAEAFRLLAVRLRHLRRDRTLKKVLITSTIPQEGKSLVAGNLASTLALRTQQKVLVLEGDVRRPSLSKMFGLGNNPGLCEWLEGERSLASSVYHLSAPGLWILPAGSAPSHALELLQVGKLSMLMDQLTAWFDWIIIDSPPVLPLADTSVWMRLADGILLVTRQGTTEKRKLQRGIEALEPEKLIGAVVNGSANATDSDYYYGPATASRLANR